MKILVLNAFGERAATTIRMKHLSKELSKHHKIVFVSYAENPRKLHSRNFHHVVFKQFLPSPFYHFFQMFLKLFVCLFKKYDVIYVSKPLPWALFPALIAKAIRKKPIILDWDEHEYAIISRVTRFKLYLKLMGVIEKKGVMSADKLVVVSPYLKRLALRWGVSKKKIRVVQNGVNIKEFKPSSSKEEVRKKFGLGGKIVMFVGALRKQFDIDILFKSMPYIHEEVDNVMLVIVGRGEYEGELRMLANKLHIPVTFLGYQPYKNVPSIMNAADVVVAPNRNNNMNKSRSPVKIAEYMAVGVPVVGNAVGLADEMLPKKSKVLSDQPDEMAEKIINILSNRSLASELRSQNKLRVKKYTWKALGQELNDFIS